MLPYDWGTTRDETEATYACDPLVAEPREQLFRAISVDAPVDVVFRWLCQLRVAPYSYDWIDNYGRRSPRELTPGLEQLEVGQPVMRIFELESFETNRHLTLVLTDRSAKRAFGDLAVTYAVSDAGGGRTRLIAKLVVGYPRTFRGRAMRGLLPWGDLVMMRKQFHQLKKLSEAQCRNQARGRSPATA